jgi:hypothetical protein
MLTFATNTRVFQWVAEFAFFVCREWMSFLFSGIFLFTSIAILAQLIDPRDNPR